jgi:hypothetical protein
MLRLLLVGYIQVLARAVGTLLAGAVSPVTLAGVGAAYAALVLASVYITELELRLPLVHYKTPYVQVLRLLGASGPGFRSGSASVGVLLCIDFPQVCCAVQGSSGSGSSATRALSVLQAQLIELCRHLPTVRNSSAAVCRPMLSSSSLMPSHVNMRFVACLVLGGLMLKR